MPSWALLRSRLIKLQGYLKEGLAFLVGAPLAIFLLLIEPFHKVRFVHIGRIHHIGWLAVNCYYYLGTTSGLFNKKGFSAFVLMFDPDNRALFEVFKRYLPVVENTFANHFANIVAPFLRRTRFLRDDHRQFRHFEPWCSVTTGVVALSNDEERRGRKLLEEMGIGPTDWFACIHARDSGYDDSPYRNYRNCDIRNYLPAAEYITQRGGYAIRMGAKVENAIHETGNIKIIDYATTCRSEFMDIYLSARCKYFIGNTSGIILAPLIFGKPFAQANCIPFCDTGTKIGCPWIPKLIREKDIGRYLTFREIYDLGLFSPAMTSELFVEMCRDMKLEWVENSGDEILDLCRDVDDAANGILPPDGAFEIQRHYHETFVPFRDRLNDVPFIAPRFALRHHKLILT